MAFALVASTKAQQASATSSAIDTTGANLLVAVIANLQTAATPTPTDVYGNTWTAAPSNYGSVGGHSRIYVFYVASPTVGPGHTFTLPATGGAQPEGVFSAWSGASAIPYDSINGAESATQPIYSGSLTPRQTDCLVITGVSGDAFGITHSVNSDFTVLQSNAGASGLAWNGAAAYLIQTTAVADNPQWTATGATYPRAVIVAFRSDISAAPPLTHASYSERDIAILTQQRLGLPASAILGLQTLVPAALNNLAKAVALDPARRPLLLTDPTTTTVDFELGSNGTYTASLNEIISTQNVMLDYIRYGTMWVSGTTSVLVSGAGTAAANRTYAYVGLSEGRPSFHVTAQSDPDLQNIVWQTNSPDPGGQWIILNNTDGDTWYQSTDDVFYPWDATTWTLGSGSGAGATPAPTVATTPVLVQWLASPNQGQLTSAIPVPYPTVYLVGTTLYGNNVGAATVRFSVPYTPTVSAFPNDVPLTADLLDQMVELYMTKGPSPANINA